MDGDLTIKGNTRPVTLAVVKYDEFNDPNMGHRIGYSAEGQINRKKFGLTRNMLMDGRWVVSDETRIMIKGQFVEKPALSLLAERLMTRFSAYRLLAISPGCGQKSSHNISRSHCKGGGG